VRGKKEKERRKCEGENQAESKKHSEIISEDGTLERRITVEKKKQKKRTGMKE